MENWDARFANYFLVSSFVALLYDIVLTLPSEYELIWSTPLTWASLLYTWMRYGNVIWQGISLAFHICSDAPHLSCETWYLIDSWVAYALFLPTTVFLSLRMYALYRDQDWYHKWLMICMFGALHCTILACLGAQTDDILEYPSSADCNLSNLYIKGFVPNIAIVLYYASLLGLTVHSVCKYFRAGDRRITYIISQDVLLYTAVLTCASIATLVICLTQPSFRSFPASLSSTLAVITSSRLVLNLKKIVIEPDSVALRTLTATPMTLDTLGPISFRSRAQVDWEEGCFSPRPTK